MAGLDNRAHAIPTLITGPEIVGLVVATMKKTCMTHITEDHHLRDEGDTTHHHMIDTCMVRREGMLLVLDIER